ncbi:MAG: outer membrane protein assembly factor BamE [Verrucomicrobium sp.]|nr:outer membrane protein assembly factor BamE [Verrucomicrobium sp.]
MRARVLFLSALLLTACLGPTQANLDRVRPGMSPVEVRALLGKPDRVESSETIGAAGLVYFYGKDVRVVFLNRAVLSKEGRF